DEEYLATCPAFPGLSAYGTTEEEALVEAKIALGLFIEACEANNIPLPEPQVAQEYSGQTRVRFPKSLHRQLAQKAESEGISLNLVILNACQTSITGDQVGQQYLNEMKKLVQNQSALASLGSAAFGNPSFREKVTTKTERIINAPGFDFREKGN
ncbi:MAG TPA: type II toxin-antitoxin system HicB family antitoxin, partial [Blastocatellia bacterium]|nr:type II toxin-antitoxin system HicB family antitoxin [Blastocatellia bacterium]